MPEPYLTRDQLAEYVGRRVEIERRRGHHRADLRRCLGSPIPPTAPSANPVEGSGSPPRSRGATGWRD